MAIDGAIEVAAAQAIPAELWIKNERREVEGHLDEAMLCCMARFRGRVG